MPETTTRFAVLQCSLEIPEVEKLKRAFRSVKSLTESDAHTLANDAFGILVNNLSPQDAMSLQGALLAEGIRTAVVLQSDLPQLPPAKFVRRTDCLPEALMIYDPVGRTVPVPWSQVMLIAAGNVRLADFAESKIVRPARASGYGFEPARYELPAWGEEEMKFHLLLEIVLSRSATRFQTQADKFLFLYLGERKQSGLLENFALLVQDLMKFAPQAMANRGAFFLRENTTRVFEYPSKHAFYEEMTWMLWQAAHAQRAGET